MVQHCKVGCDVKWDPRGAHERTSYLALTNRLDV